MHTEGQICTKFKLNLKFGLGHLSLSFFRQLSSTKDNTSRISNDRFFKKKIDVK